MSTDFLDVLESQLDAAAGRRYGRPAPRRRFGEIALVAVSVAAVVLAVVMLSGRGTTHDARTPQPAQAGPAIGAAARGVPITVVGLDLAAAEKLASRLSRATGTHVRFTDRGAFKLEDTEVLWAPGYAGAALAVSEFITDIPSRLAALRVHGGEATARAAGTPVVVRLGRTDVVAPGATYPGPPAPVDFRAGCPSHPRRLSEKDADNAVQSVLLAWPQSDRAVPLWSAPRATDDIGVDPKVVNACGADVAARSAVVNLELTAGGTDGSRVLMLVACEGDHFRVWKTLRL